MAKATGKHAEFNTDGSPAGLTQVQFRITNADASVVVAGPIGDPFSAATTPYSLNLPLNPAQQSAAHHGEVRSVNFDNTPSPWLNIGAPAGGFTAAVPGPPTDNVITNS